MKGKLQIGSRGVLGLGQHSAAAPVVCSGTGGRRGMGRKRRAPRQGETRPWWAAGAWRRQSCAWDASILIARVGGWGSLVACFLVLSFYSIYFAVQRWLAQSLGARGTIR